MSKAPSLSESEKAVILTLKKENKSISQISKEINRSRGVISNFLKDPCKYGTKKSSGRPKKLSIRTRSKILKLARGKKITSSAIKSKLALDVSKKTIIRGLKKDGKLNRMKIKRKPKLSKAHKKNRLLFSGKYQDLGENWKKVIFSDEKKFNLDGPDGYNFYWAGINTEEVVYSRRAMGGPSIMIWACFNYHGKSKLAFIDGTVNSLKYQDILRDYLIPFITEQNIPEVLFQQDNAKPHVSISTKNWLEVNNIDTMFWPAFSPDLNPIENLWGELSRLVYGDNKTYNSLNELKTSILENWEKISLRYCKKLVESMETRIEAVIKNDGGSTKY